MSDAESDPLGPVGYLVVEVPDGGASGFAELLTLVEADAVRVLDLEVVRKGADGSVLVVDAASAGALAAFAGASTGLLDPDDLAELAEVLPAGATAAVIVYESVWALRLAPGARLLAEGPVSVDELDSVLGPDED